MVHRRLALVAALSTFGLAAVPTSPAAAATSSCKSVVKSGSGSAKKIRATSMSCTKARTVAKAYIGTYSAPSGYTCSYKQAGFSAGQLQFDVRCARKSGKGRLTFRMATSALPPAAPTPPIVGGS